MTGINRRRSLMSMLGAAFAGLASGAARPAAPPEKLPRIMGSSWNWAPNHKSGRWNEVDPDRYLSGWASFRADGQVGIRPGTQPKDDDGLIMRSLAAGGCLPLPRPGFKFVPIHLNVEPRPNGWSDGGIYYTVREVPA